MLWRQVQRCRQCRGHPRHLGRPASPKSVNGRTQRCSPVLMRHPPLGSHKRTVPKAHKPDPALVDHHPGQAPLCPRLVDHHPGQASTLPTPGRPPPQTSLHPSLAWSTTTRNKHSLFPRLVDHHPEQASTPPSPGPPPPRASFHSSPAWSTTATWGPGRLPREKSGWPQRSRGSAGKEVKHLHIERNLAGRGCGLRSDGQTSQRAHPAHL